MNSSLGLMAAMSAALVQPGPLTWNPGGQRKPKRSGKSKPACAKLKAQRQVRKKQRRK